MPNDTRDHFDKYAPEPRTTAAVRPTAEGDPEKLDVTRYGIGKPRRIIVRGTIASDKGFGKE